MDALSSTAALFLAIVLASAAGHKLVATDRLATAAARLARAPGALGLPLSLAAATIEATAAVALLFPQTRLVGAIVAAALWTGYGALLLAARRAAPFDCGCSFGPPRPGREGHAPARAFALAVLALLTAALPAVAAPGLLQFFAAFTFFALYLAANELAALAPYRRSLAR
jgi:hypothetical protein